jgi:carboxyl-terminal processing protease
MDQSDYNSIVNNSFNGIGITIQATQNGIQVTTVMVNSPAMKAGIKEGDIIIAADDNYLNGLTAVDSLNLLNGEPGVPEELKVNRKNQSIIVSVTPATVYYPTVYSKIIDNNIGYIHILSFGANTLAEFEYNINSQEMKSVDSYMIDLRNNPGGFIYSAVEIAGYFAKNNTVALFQSKNGEKFKFNATEKNNTIDKPNSFLVNGYTASAAELLAACAQDYGTAVIIGEKTYGKGVAQSTFELSDGSILKTTTLKIYSPNGRDINNGGVTPDIRISGVDSTIASQLLYRVDSKMGNNSSIAKVVINNKDYYVNIDKIINNYYLEAYRQIIGQATNIDVSSYSKLNGNSKTVTNIYPVLKYAEVPKTEYKVGDRVTFKLSSPNYNGFVQYRAMLWDETTNKYVDLWNTKDRYYDKWKPKGKDVFTISFPVIKAGNYKVKVFVKRSGILNSKAVLKGMNCDSYVYEIPYTIVASH